MASQPRERVRVAYPGYETCTLNIITENLHSAQIGNESMQRSMAWQFFKALGYDRPPRWDWEKFDFTLTGEAGRPPKHSKDAEVELQGCTCVRDCAACDQGWHQSCRYYCQFGQPVFPQ